MVAKERVLLMVVMVASCYSVMSRSIVNCSEMVSENTILFMERILLRQVYIFPFLSTV